MTSRKKNILFIQLAIFLVASILLYNTYGDRDKKSKEIVKITEYPFRIFNINNFFDYNFYLDIKKLFQKLDPKEVNLTKNFGKTFISSYQAKFDNDKENQIFSKLNKIIFSDEFFYFFVKYSYIKNAMSQSNILRKIKNFKVITN